MAKQYVDVWKYPHMTYKKAFVIATIISIITVGVAFISFSDYIESQMTGSLQINFLTEQEAEKQVEEIKEQIKEEKAHELQHSKELENNNVQLDNGGAGHGGQNGNFAVPTKSDVSPSSQQASAGEIGTVKQSSVGSNTGVDLSELKVLESGMHQQVAEKGLAIVKVPEVLKLMSVVAAHSVMMGIGVIYKVQLIVITLQMHTLWGFKVM